VDWHVGHTADDFILTGAVQPLIIVGIYNIGKSRIHEYTPTKAPRLGGGRADRYAKFLTQEVMPFIHREYRVVADARVTGIGGSSLGGLLSLYLGLMHPRVFGRIAALSPSVWWNQRVLHRMTAAANIEPRPRIWLDIGTQEARASFRRSSNIATSSAERLQLGKDLSYQRVEGAEHNEAAWARRVGPFLRFLYPAAESTV